MLIDIGLGVFAVWGHPILKTTNRKFCYVFNTRFTNSAQIPIYHKNRRCLKILFITIWHTDK
jgi:hypothetical protein